jgi:hypothetical protein
MQAVFNAKLRSLYPRERDPVPKILEAGWARGPVRTGAKIEPAPRFDPRTSQSAANRYID